MEILDSRSRPTLGVTVGLEGGVIARAGVPSGASTGTREARELRDGDSSRFEGRGVAPAVGHVGGEIADHLVGTRFANLAELDAALISLDGTPDKSRLGANAIVGVSIAVARGVARAAGRPLWATLSLASPSCPRRGWRWSCRRLRWRRRRRADALPGSAVPCTTGAGVALRHRRSVGG